MASTTNFGHELSHSTDDYTFALGSGDPTAVLIIRVSDGTYKNIISQAGVQIPSLGTAQTNTDNLYTDTSFNYHDSIKLRDNYLLLDFTIPYQHLDGGQVLYLD